MLDYAPNSLRDYVDEAIALRKEHTDATRQIIRDYAGNNFRLGWKQAAPIYENHSAEYIDNMLPNICMHNPSVDVESGMPGMADFEIEALQSWGPDWIRKIRLVKTLREIANNTMFNFGVGVVDVEVLPGFDTAPEPQPMRPYIWSLSPTRYFRDSETLDRLLPRFEGHWWIKDKNDCLNEVDSEGQPKYDPIVVEAMAADSGVQEFSRELMKEDRSGKSGRKSRNQIVGYEIWSRETNMVYTIGYVGSTGKTMQGEYMRDPRAYFGPPSGPYQLYGLKFVPEQVYPLSPLAVTHEKVQEINKHRRQVSEDAAAAKTLIAYDSKHKQAGQAITKARNNTVIGIPGLNAIVQQLRLGGVNPENLQYVQTLREELYQLSGLNDVIRGKTSGVTATEIDQAQGAADTRSKFARTLFKEDTVELLNKAFWFAHESPLVQSLVRVTDPTTGMKSTALFVGGPQEGMPHLPYDALELTIRPYSMEDVDEVVLQKRMQDGIMLVSQIVPLGLQYPCIRVKPLIDDAFETLNVRGAGERYVDWGIFQQMMQMAAMQQVMGVQGQANEVEGGAVENQARKKEMSKPAKAGTSKSNIKRGARSTK